MARDPSKAKAGYLRIEEKHYAALLSLVKPGDTSRRILDPFAGKGAFLEAAANAWQLTPYACELDRDRAQACIDRFGLTQAVQGDAERLRASTGAFSAGWFNPPYDHDSAAKQHKRVEFRMLRHAWKWIQPEGLVLWCVYKSHLTQKAAEFFAKHSSQVDVWSLPGKHQGEYDQIVVAAIKSSKPLPESDRNRLYQRIQEQQANPPLLEVQDDPLYVLPPAPSIKTFVFTPDNIDEEAGLRLVEAHGAWQQPEFQRLMQPPAKIDRLEPVVTPRPGHMALVLAAGVADGAVLPTEDYGTVALRSKTRTVEEKVNVEEVETDVNLDQPPQRITWRKRPKTTLTLLDPQGGKVTLEGDEQLLKFITTNQDALSRYLNTRFAPLYEFDFNGLQRPMSRIRLKGKYKLYTPQKHVIGAITRGLADRKGMWLVGQMGTGKTAMGGTAAVLIARGLVDQLKNQTKPGQVTLIVCPPHLVDKWKRELLDVDPDLHIEHLKRHEDVKAFMAEAERRAGITPSIGLVKTTSASLGSSFTPAVIWKPLHVPKKLPDGTEIKVIKRLKPTCPSCGKTVFQNSKTDPKWATRDWLKKGQRWCDHCHAPLWSEARDRYSQPGPEEKFPSKNPRYRLDKYIHRHYKDRVFLLIWDEVHEAAQKSGRGEAFMRLGAAATKILAMTGTPTNGRASSVYYIEYTMNPAVQQRYPRGGARRLYPKVRGSKSAQGQMDADELAYDSQTQWVEDMGVLEAVEEEKLDYDGETGVCTGTTSKMSPYKEAPGASPLLIAGLLDHAVFFSLKDLGKALPEYREEAVPITPDPELQAEYDNRHETVEKHLLGCIRDGDKSFLGAYLQWAMSWPNAPWRDTKVIHKQRDPWNPKKIVPYTVTDIPAMDPGHIYAKEQALIDLVTGELAQGRGCAVYVRQTASRDIQPRLKQLLDENVPGCVSHILNTDSSRREKKIAQEIAAGTNVLITNPKKVATGLDLLHFKTMIFYEPHYELGVMLQASARSYRLNQEDPLCKVYFLYYQGLFEETAIYLMSKKQRASKLLTGELGLTGLDELTEGEGSFENALREAIGQNDALVDVATLMQQEASFAGMDGADAAYWQSEDALEEEAEFNPETDGLPLFEVELPPEAVEVLPPETAAEADPLVEMAQEELGGVVAAVTPTTPESSEYIQQASTIDHYWRPLLEARNLTGSRYQDLWAELRGVILNGHEEDPDADGWVKPIYPISSPNYQQTRTNLESYLRAYLKRKTHIERDLVEQLAPQLIVLAEQALGRKEKTTRQRVADQRHKAQQAAEKKNPPTTDETPQEAAPETRSVAAGSPLTAVLTRWQSILPAWDLDYTTHQADFTQLAETVLQGGGSITGLQDPAYLENRLHENRLYRSVRSTLKMTGLLSGKPANNLAKQLIQEARLALGMEAAETADNPQPQPQPEHKKPTLKQKMSKAEMQAYYNPPAETADETPIAVDNWPTLSPVQAEKRDTPLEAEQVEYTQLALF